MALARRLGPQHPSVSLLLQIDDVGRNLELRGLGLTVALVSLAVTFVALSIACLTLAVTLVALAVACVDVVVGESEGERRRDGGHVLPTVGLEGISVKEGIANDGRFPPF